MANVYIKLPLVTADALENGVVFNQNVAALAQIDWTKIGNGAISQTEAGYLNNLDTNIKDKFTTLDTQITALSNFYRIVIATTTSGQVISTETETTIVWDQADHDPDSWLNTSTGVISIPSTSGTFFLAFTFAFNADNVGAFEFNEYIKGIVYQSGVGQIAKDIFYYQNAPEGAANTELLQGLTVIAAFYTDSGGFDIETRLMHNNDNDLTLTTEAGCNRVMLFKVSM